MHRIFSADELILDDSFISYCNKSNANDAIFWENYLIQHPGEKATIEEAKAFVCGLKTMLRDEEKQRSIQNFIGALQAQQTTNHPPLRKLTNAHGWLAAASLAFIVIICTWILNEGNTRSPMTARGDKTRADSAASVRSPNQVIKTGAAQIKVFYLADGTKVTMNANTTITISSNFGNPERLVNLDGEAFFDVKHNGVSPFIVRLNDFDVKVLGTMFNVRSYPGDKTSEATLVKGKVEIVLKNHAGKKLFLQPNQKVVVNNTQFNGPSTTKVSKDESASVNIQPSSISSDGSSMIETAWMQNRLEISDETFIDLKSKLERKYGVTIIFSDEAVKQYRFTATFENESIDQALKALQISDSFNYTIKNNEITISK